MKKTLSFLSLFLFLPLSGWSEEPFPLSEGSSFSDQLFHMILSLGFVIILLVIGTWVLKRFFGQRLQQLNSSCGIKIIERRTLSPKSVLYIVEIEGKKILIGETPAGINSLATFPITEK